VDQLSRQPSLCEIKGERVLLLLLATRLLLLHLLHLWCSAERTRLRLLLLLRWPSEGIEGVLAHGSLHAWLISVHLHASHRVVQGPHRHHVTHRVLLLLLHATHRLEWHRLEASASGWLLHGAEDVRLGLLLRAAHHIGEWVRPRQLLLRLELVCWLLATWLLLLFIIVKALEH